MSKTMLEFHNVLKDINDLKEKESLMQERFERSTDELSECFHWMIKCALEGRKHCSLTVDTCPELYAKELIDMGFKLEEQRNYANTLYGYDIYWD